jgi:hypothetical protein
MTEFNDQYHQSFINAYEKDFIGTKVIILSNEKDPILLGTLISWNIICQSGQRIPVVRTTCGDKFVLGTIIPYSDEVWMMIKNMNSREAWILFSGIKQVLEKTRRMHECHTPT